MNYHNSSLYPINLPQENAKLFVGLLGCSIGTMPFTHLGLPMGTTRPRVVDFAPLGDRVERRLIASSLFLPQGGMLTLIIYVLSSIPTYYMCSLQLSVSVAKAIDTARKNCLWRGNNPSSSRKSLASWEIVFRPKVKGGLGIINLRVQNTTLLLKHLVKFYKGEDLPWVQLIWNSYYGIKVPHMIWNKGSFWWRDIIALSDIFRGISRCTVRTGSSALFWDDPWNEEVGCLTFSNLFSVALDKKQSVQQLSSHPLEDCFPLALRSQSYEEFLNLEEEISFLNLQDGKGDDWSFLWNSDRYTANKFYKLTFMTVQTSKTFCLDMENTMCFEDKKSLSGFFSMID